MKKIWKLLCFFAQHESSCPFFVLCDALFFCTFALLFL